MQIVNYPYPTLRHKSRPIKRVDAKLREIVREMFELMYESEGVGLAANQVDLPLRLFVVNLTASPKEGEELVFINPVIKPQKKGLDEDFEGCLSIPGVHGPVKRPKQVKISAFNLQGEEIEAVVDGLFARVVQHETDHLDGVLFTDRLTETAKADVQPMLEDFEGSFEYNQRLGAIPPVDVILERLKEWEARYC